jgi:hypothetical protein
MKKIYEVIDTYSNESFLISLVNLTLFEEFINDNNLKRKYVFRRLPYNDYINSVNHRCLNELFELDRQDLQDEINYLKEIVLNNPETKYQYLKELNDRKN